MNNRNASLDYAFQLGEQAERANQHAEMKEKLLAHTFENDDMAMEEFLQGIEYMKARRGFDMSQIDGIKAIEALGLLVDIAEPLPKLLGPAIVISHDLYDLMRRSFGDNPKYGKVLNRITVQCPDTIRRGGDSRA